MPASFAIWDKKTAQPDMAALLRLVIQKIVNGADDLSLPIVETGDAAADTADKFVVKAVSGCGDLLHGDHIISVTAHCRLPAAFFGSVTTGISRWGIPL